MRVLILTAGIIIVDQVTKLLVRGLHWPALGISWEGMPYGMSRPVLGDFFRLTYIENPGMAFGTGTHETTRLCLAALEKHRKQRFFAFGETAPPSEPAPRSRSSADFPNKVRSYATRSPSNMTSTG